MAKYAKSRRNKSVMKHQFSQVPSVSIPRSSFNRSHGYKTTFDSGKLVPFYVDEVLPGDTFSLNATLFTRMMSALEVPVMDNMFLETFFFFVPNRLIWDNFQKFMGEQIDPDDSTDFLVPILDMGTVGSGDIGQGSLGDYFGIPPGVNLEDAKINALPFRAYNLIWNDWFRDENLQGSLSVPRDDGPDYVDDINTVRRRGKRHDYFTSALPWPQKGPGVELPLGATAPLIVDPDRTVQPDLVYYEDGNLASTAAAIQTDSSGRLTLGNAFGFTYPRNVVADLSNATAASINSLRQAFQLQRLLERDARGGTRYTEIIRSHFGVVSPDARLQRPEFLGGGSVPIGVQPIPQTSAADGQPTPQGNLSAFALGASNRNGFSKSFVEHGLVIGLVNVRADLTYQQGIPRMFSRRTKYDYYWPALAHLGEQAIYNKEIYAQGTAADDEVFGYQERWAEYRYFPSKITGKLRSTDPQPLDIWHLSQKFENLPTLSSTFIEDKPPIERIVAVTDEPQFVLDVFVSAKCARPMPVYSVPGMIDHF